MKNSTEFNAKSDLSVSKRKKRILNKNNSYQGSSDVLVSAVISPYLLTHLHQILRKSEINAKKDGRLSHAANFSKLRKVLCLDARSMEDASASEINDFEKDLYISKNSNQNVA